MENSESPEAPVFSRAARIETKDEEAFIASYIELTGASLAEARSTYMYSEFIQQRDPYSYRLE
jgi:hypothetical protein